MVVTAGGEIRGRDVEIAAALSSDRGGGADRSVHVDPFVERNYTSQSVAQSEVRGYSSRYFAAMPMDRCCALP